MNHTIIWVLLGVGLLMWVLATISQIRRDNIRMNDTLNRIAKQVGVPDVLTDEIKKLILEHESVKAIRLYRKVTGCGLTEAKEYIDSLKKEIKI